MNNPNLSLKERETIKQFVLNINKEFQKLQKCITYQDTHNTMENLNKKMDTSNWSTNFLELGKTIDKTLNKNKNEKET